MKTYKQFLEMAVTEKRQTYDYGCAMVYFEAPELLELHKEIDSEDVHENGIETEPHTTLLYGLHSDDIPEEDVLKICKEANYEPIKLDNISLFTNPEFDVLKFDAHSEVLHKVNSELTKLPHTTDYPDYHPHATIAYLKPGKGKDYVKKFKDKTILVKPKEIVYSKADGNKIIRKL